MTEKDERRELILNDNDGFHEIVTFAKDKIKDVQIRQEIIRRTQRLFERTNEAFRNENSRHLAKINALHQKMKHLKDKASELEYKLKLRKWRIKVLEHSLSREQLRDLEEHPNPCQYNKQPEVACMSLRDCPNIKK